MEMKTAFAFRSSKFPPYEGEEDQINPGLWGKRLAEYFQEKLRAEGFETRELIPEDWGWIVPVKNRRFSMWIGCGHQMEEDIDFLCFVEPHRSRVFRWFWLFDTTADVTRLMDAVKRILSRDPDITDVRWGSPDEL